MRLSGQSECRNGELRDKISAAWPYLLILLLTMALAHLSCKREILNYETETDFLGGFVPEARRFLNGEPLQVEFHIPFYSIVLACVYMGVNDWMRSGLLLSLAAALVMMVACHEFFRLRFGKIAGLGAILALAFSATFIRFAMQATSDVFFHALFFGALACIAYAETGKTIFFWAGAGLFAGMAIITRTNGIALLGLGLLALTSANKNFLRKRASLFFAIGAGIPILAWSVFAVSIGAPVFPTANYKNLALTFFAEGGDRISGDALLNASQGLANATQVLTKAPGHIAKIYCRDLLANARKLFSEEGLLSFPWLQLALPGLVFLLVWKRNTFNRVLGFVLAGIFLLLNMKAWDNRFFLYMAPFMGAGVASLLARAQAKLKKKQRAGQIISMRFGLVLFLLGSAVFGLQSIKAAVSAHFSGLPFEAIAAAKILESRAASPEEMVIARKPHLSFYAHLDSEWFPNVETLAELQAALAGQPAGRKRYLFYGCIEKHFRPQFMALASPEFNASWLNRIGWGRENGGWVLYEIRRDGFELNYQE